MLERMNWEAVYQLWKHGVYYFPQSLTSPLAFEKVSVDYRGSGYFYGYDWLENTETAQRKMMIQTNIAEFLIVKPSSRHVQKGQTSPVMTHRRKLQFESGYCSNCGNRYFIA